MKIKENIAELNRRIEIAAEKTNRSRDKIKLIAVTKTHPVPKIEEALDCNLQFIGENKVQEAEEKIPKLQGKYEEFHFIGHLQSNKIKKLIPLKPALIHSIDKFSTAKKLNNYIIKQQLSVQDILVQVNTSGEESKFGINPQDTEALIEKISQLSHLQIKGLMTIGLFTDDEKKIRQCFQILKEKFEEFKKKTWKNVQMKYLSMGMTNDFEIAIEEGANMIRVGTAIFGAREY